MCVKKLLAAASVAALMAGAASAIEVTVDVADTEIASEIDFDTDPGTAGIEGVTANAVGGAIVRTLDVSTVDPLGAGSNFLLTVNLTGPASFDALTTAAVGGDEIDSAIVSAGGGDGTTSVTFLVTTNAPPDLGNTITVDIPMRITGCGDVSANINLTDDAGNPIEGGTASLQDGGGDIDDGVSDGLAVNVFECVSAFGGTVAPESPPNDLLALATNFSTFLGSGASTDLSDLALTVDTTVLVAPGGVLNDTMAAFGDVTDFDLDITFADATNFAAAPTTVQASGALFGATVNLTGANSPVFELRGVPAAAGAGVLTLNVAGGTTNPITPQQPVVSDAELGFDPASGLITNENIVVTGNGSDGIALEGANFGPFDWVPDASFTPITVFRGTGFDPADVPPAVVTISNSSLGGAANGTFPLDLTGLISPGGQLVLTNVSLEGQIGAPYGIGDVTLTFFTSGTLDIDRLISTEGVVSAFGDDGNFDAAGVIFGGRQTTVAD